MTRTREIKIKIVGICQYLYKNVVITRGSVVPVIRLYTEQAYRKYKEAMDETLMVSVRKKNGKITKASGIIESVDIIPDRDIDRIVKIVFGENIEFNKMREFYKKIEGSVPNKYILIKVKVLHVSVLL